jgi:hypothetical protein
MVALITLLAGAVLPLLTLPAMADTRLAPLPGDAQTALVRRYLTDLQHAAFNDAYGLLNASARAYFRNAGNFHSVYAADAYRIERFALLAKRATARDGSVFFARETARYRDYAHDVDLLVTATVPVGVVPDHGGWRIKDPGHPWRAFAAHASANTNGLRVTVKKMSFFARRIEVTVTFGNLGDAFVTLLPYGKSLLRDASGTPYRIIETRNWWLTDKTLFEGLRLAPNAQYTGTLTFACQPLDDAQRTYSLTVGPLLVDGADTPFGIDVDGIAANNPSSQDK